MTSSEGGPRRRRFLQAMTAGLAGWLAGCNTPSDDETTEPPATTEFGYGGSPTPTATQLPTRTETPTGPNTQTTSPAEDYGEQAYGQYGYGG